MIVYSPINGEVLTDAIKYYPRKVFVMTQLGEPLPSKLISIRKDLKKELKKYNLNEKDAASLVTGKDFLDKIWKLILGVQIGIAILTEDIPTKTIGNIFYELGMMDSLGKETIIIKSEKYEIPSDFKRTEYLNFDSKFSTGFKKFINNLNERESHYWLMSDLMKADPVLAIDYAKRAYLLSSREEYKAEAEKIYNRNIDSIDSQSALFIKNFLRS